MKNLLLVFLSLSSVLLLYSQEQKVIKSEVIRADNELIAVLPVSGSEFFSLRWGIKKNKILTHHSNFVIDAENKIQQTVDGKTTEIENVFMMNNEAIAFLSIIDNDKQKHRLFVLEYDKKCIPKKEAVLVAEFAIPKGWRDGKFVITQSENQQFYGVEFEFPTDAEARKESCYKHFAVKVLDNTFNLVSEGEYQCKFNDYRTEVTNRHASNTGNYFIGLKVYHINERNKVEESTHLESFIILHTTPSGIQEFSVDIENDKRIMSTQFTTDNNHTLFFNGLYGVSEDPSGIKGVYNFRFDAEKNVIFNEGYLPFGTDFILLHCLDDYKEDVLKNQAKGITNEPVLSNFASRTIIALSDGSLLAIWEENNAISYYSANGTGGSSPETLTYFNDVILYKITPDGKFSWLRKFAKQQSLAYKGPCSIYPVVMNDSKVVCFFNDNNDNYDDNLNYRIPEGELALGLTYKLKDICLASYEVDLNTGEEHRRILLKDSELIDFPAPKKFRANQKQKDVLMVLFCQRKEQFGLISF